MKELEVIEMLLLLVRELGIQFIHFHPSLERIFLELPRIDDPRIMKLVVMTLMSKFEPQIKEARGILLLYDES